MTIVAPPITDAAETLDQPAPGTLDAPTKAECTKELTPRAPVRLGEVASFEPGALVFDLDFVAARIRRKEFSASTMNDFAGKCLAKWAAGKVLPQETSPLLPPLDGSMAHDALENFYALPMEERTREALMEKIRDSVHSTVGDDLGLRKLAIERVLVLLDGLYDIENPRRVDVVSVEQEFHLIIDGVPVVGHIDRVSRDENGRILIEDYKTGKLPNPKYSNDYEYQARLYAIAYEMLTGERPVAARLLYTQFGESLWVDIDEDSLAETRKRLVAQWEKHNDRTATGRFDTKVGPLCGWCPLVSVCSDAIKAGKTLSDRAPMEALDPFEHGFTPESDTTAEEGSTASMDVIEGLRQMRGRGRNESQQMNEHNAPTQSDHEEEPEMTKPWTKYDGDELNPNSWAANTLFRLRGDVAVWLSDHEDLPTEDFVEAYKAIAHLLGDAQVEAFGHGPDPQEGSFTRLHHLLASLIRVHPIPAPEEEEAFSQWLGAMLDELINGAADVYDIFEELEERLGETDSNKPEDPWDTPSSEPPF
ncbi:PD-(D/E)XK nuclease family protein [Nesterenkonia rhizosphaerae]|uniref:PD-(D/E)XK endonuclease-like domain-containing protein n=1 Tax=Nesterenkonia rhizosphaerae TaxID=1348272 RepID=A0ABP9G3P1_9MICC